MTKSILVMTKSILSVLAFSLAASTFAQGVNNDKPSEISLGYIGEGIASPYTRIYAEYNPTTFEVDVRKKPEVDLTGFSVGVLRGISISKKYPLFLEVGGRLTYAFSTKGMDDLEELRGVLESHYSNFLQYQMHNEEVVDASVKLSYVGLTIPVNLTYRYELPNSQVAISPLLGLALRANIIAKAEAEMSTKGHDPYTGYYNSHEYSTDVNFFDKYDIGENFRFRRVELGWQIGATVSVHNKYSIGLRYGAGMTGIAKWVSTRQWAVQVGMFI